MWVWASHSRPGGSARVCAPVSHCVLWASKKVCLYSHQCVHLWTCLGGERRVWNMFEGVCVSVSVRMWQRARPCFPCVLCVQGSVLCRCWCPEDSGVCVYLCFVSAFVSFPICEHLNVHLFCVRVWWMSMKEYMRQIESVCNYAGVWQLVSVSVVEWLLLGIFANVCVCICGINRMCWGLGSNCV